MFSNVEIFSTCPASSGSEPSRYLQSVADVARWSEEGGCKGILVYSDNSLVDPWLVSQAILQSTRALCPLVAVQPVYMHPYAVAKMVATFGSLYGRRIYLNMIAGGFKNDLLALNDTTPHDQRYDRLQEYTAIVLKLLEGAHPVSFEGRFYRVDRLKLAPPLLQELYPGVFVSGSSEAGMAAAKAIGATAIRYPGPAGEEKELPPKDVAQGIRVGIITRPEESEAWDIAYRRFPADRKGQLTHQLAMKVSDSVWHQQLSQTGTAGEESPYWLVPFQNYKTMCPYLVGSYAAVGAELSRYFSRGCLTVILDIPPNGAEFEHIHRAVDLAVEKVRLKGLSDERVSAPELRLGEPA
jgi:alkanesulfonate monooxygenase